jgi:hypothetical protein
MFNSLRNWQSSKKAARYNTLGIEMLLNQNNGASQDSLMFLAHPKAESQ